MIKKKTGLSDEVKAIKEKKEALGLSNRALAEKSGVPIGTIQKILSGESERPRYDTILKIETALSSCATAMRESRFEYGSSREDDGERKTRADYYAIPEGQRAELIDGVIYYMTKPTIKHQKMADLLGRALEDIVDRYKGECIVFGNPINLHISKYEDSTLEPDVTVVCDMDKVKDRHVEGAPDLVVEILSPSTRDRDTTIKLEKYMTNGVREYWMVDIDNNRVMVCESKAPDILHMYKLSDEVPVGIFGGKATIDFKAIMDNKVMSI